jgi:hypothetical protein
MDKYAILCIISLIILCFWHAAMGFLIFQLTPDFRLTPNMWLTFIDRCVFLLAIILFILIHIGLLLWIYFVPLKHRRNMEKEDSDYRQIISNKDKKTFDYIPISM